MSFHIYIYGWVVESFEWSVSPGWVAPSALNEVKKMSVNYNLGTLQWKDGYTDNGGAGDLCHLVVLGHFTDLCFSPISAIYQM